MAATPENLQFDRALIDAVRELPIIWEVCKKTNLNRNAKNNAWRLVSDILKPHSRTYEYFIICGRLISLQNEQ